MLQRRTTGQYIIWTKGNGLSTRTIATLLNPTLDGHTYQGMYIPMIPNSNTGGLLVYQTEIPPKARCELEIILREDHEIKEYQPLTGMVNK